MKISRRHPLTPRLQQNARPDPVRRGLPAARSWLLGALVASSLVLPTGCKKSSAESGAASVPQSQFVIGMSQCNLGEPWRVQQDADIKAAAAKYPELKVIFKDAQNDTLRQIYEI